MSANVGVNHHIQMISERTFLVSGRLNLSIRDVSNRLANSHQQQNVPCVQMEGGQKWIMDGGVTIFLTICSNCLKNYIVELGYFQRGTSLQGETSRWKLLDSPDRVTPSLTSVCKVTWLQIALHCRLTARMLWVRFPLGPPSGGMFSLTLVGAHLPGLVTLACSPPYSRCFLHKEHQHTSMENKPRLLSS